MGKYIKYYDTHSEYDGEKDLLDLPNVAWCEQEEDVHYNPEHDYSQDYLTFDIVSDGTLIWKRIVVNHGSGSCNINYSIDNGLTWIEISPSDTPFLNVTQGQKILFKGNYSTYHSEWGNSGTPDYESCDHNFSGTASFNVSGNIMSMISGDNFINTTSFGNQTFWFFFQNSNVINAKNLILPVLTLTKYCYARMFNNCTSLITAPELPATTLVSNCYYYMFNGCSNLNYIKAMFTTTPSTSYTNNWVSGVASNGTFVKNSAAQWNVTGVNGIPTGWTVQTASN